MAADSKTQKATLMSAGQSRPELVMKVVRYSQNCFLLGAIGLR